MAEHEGWPMTPERRSEKDAPALAGCDDSACWCWRGGYPPTLAFTEVALAAHDRQVTERAWDEGYAHGILGSVIPNPYRADSLAPRPAAPALPCFRGVRGCTEVGEHYHPDEKYAKDATPGVSVSGEQVRAHYPAGVGSVMGAEYTGPYVVCACQANRWGEGPRIPVTEYPAHVLAALGVTVTDGGAL